MRPSRRVLISAVLSVALAIPGARPAEAQTYFAGIAVHGGSLGLGADFGLQLGELFGLRAGITVLPSGVGFPIEEVDYEADLPSPQYRALLDFHPGGSSFRLSAGVLVSPDDLSVSADPEGTVEINGTEYRADQVGTLRGAVRNEDIAPYVGIGFGRPGGGELGFFMDLGAAFHGRPSLELTADGPIADRGSFRADLEADEHEFMENYSWARIYPVLALGFSFGVL